jgi:hypothetical protein
LPALGLGLLPQRPAKKALAMNQGLVQRVVETRRISTNGSQVLVAQGIFGAVARESACFGPLDWPTGHVYPVSRRIARQLQIVVAIPDAVQVIGARAPAEQGRSGRWIRVTPSHLTLDAATAGGGA